MKQGSWARRLHFPPCHTGLPSGKCRAGKGAGVGDRGAKVLRPGMRDWQRSARRIVLLAGVVSINWQGEDEINL